MSDIRTPNRPGKGVEEDAFGVAMPVQRRDVTRRRERILDTIKTLLWVAPLTLLIWIWAEREQLATQNDVSVPIEVRAAGTDRVAILLEPADRRVLIDLSGPRAALDSVRERLATPRQPIVVVVGEEAPLDREVEVVGLENRISQDNDIFARSAVRVNKVRPGVKVRVEKKLRREVPVLRNPGDALDAEVEFEPKTVTVEGPESLITSRANDLAVRADLSRFLTRKPGPYHEDVPVVSNVNGLVLLRNTVSATVNIRGLSATGKIPSLPASVAVPAFVLQQDLFAIDAPATVTAIDVSGPEELIKQLSEGKLTGSVIIALSPKQWETPGAKEVELQPENYLLPAGVKVINARKNLTVTLKRKE